MKESDRRTQRFEHEVRQTIATYLISGFKEALPALVTISRVIMPKDLRSAKVYVSVLGSDKIREECLEILQARAFEIQAHLGKSMKARFCPKLRFYIDESMDHAMAVDRAFHEIALEKKKKDFDGKKE